MATATVTDGGGFGRADYTGRFWAKAHPYGQRGPARVHLLEHHLADVGACMEALLRQPGIGLRVARAGGRAALDEATAARLAVFAALHDIGKVNIGFQTRVWTDADLPAGRRRRPVRAGHTADLTPVLDWKDWRTAEWFLPNLGFGRIEFWDDDGGATACGLFVAALSHHGQPLAGQSAQVRNAGLLAALRGFESAGIYGAHRQAAVRVVSGGLCAGCAAAAVGAGLSASFSGAVQFDGLDWFQRGVVSL